MNPTLPVTNEEGFYEIRFESIGGLGANLAGKMLAEAAVLHMGFNGANFSSYGSEKKGTPVKTFVRLGPPEQQLRTSAPVERPHLLAIFHEALIRSADPAGGIYPDSVVIVNTPRRVAELAQDLKMTSGTVGVLDALQISVEEKSRINTVMLGALARASGFLDPEAVRAVIRETFERKYPHLVQRNLKSFDRGYEELVLRDLGDAPVGAEGKPFKRPGPLWGYQNAPIGGVIADPANTVLKDMSASRQGFVPVFDRELCIDCGQCDFVCPDLCFVWEQGLDKKGRPAQRLVGIDYQYCKGCLKCVEACPVPGALSETRETSELVTSRRVPHPFVHVERVNA
ncbi:2-oxoacid:acceptor oxidoreductase family protein [Limnochorda pilosa]|uniref:Ferredoxin n=1 Tax=Limnochorda pilosa TaxID=1555112 RepID=A0A0K2SFK3_LIMPI|nr:2-oxoacid:acceptor oxidoreductase family protein [Limnochorda pilosa]BAS25876.1 ferredoxin [Limnochorda pilosa]